MINSNSNRITNAGLHAHFVSFDIYLNFRFKCNGMTAIKLISMTGKALSNPLLREEQKMRENNFSC